MQLCQVIKREMGLADGNAVVRPIQRGDGRMRMSGTMKDKRKEIQNRRRDPRREKKVSFVEKHLSIRGTMMLVFGSWPLSHADSS